MRLLKRKILFYNINNIFNLFIKIINNNKRGGLEYDYTWTTTLETHLFIWSLSICFHFGGNFLHKAFGQFLEFFTVVSWEIFEQLFQSRQKVIIFNRTAASGVSVRHDAGCAVPPCGRGSVDTADPVKGTAQPTRDWHREQYCCCWSLTTSISLLSLLFSANNFSFCELSIVHCCVSCSVLSLNVLTVSSNSSNLAFLRSLEVCAATRFFSFL